MLPNRVAIAISLHRILVPGERVVVAVSGGPDSLALLSILREILPALPLHLTVAHFDHGWRPDSRADRDFVASIATRWGYDFHSAEAAADIPHTEQAARTARFTFLRQTATATRSTAIALGHTQDDQVETLLLHLLRGSGSRGLGAMRRRDGDLARPLLDIPRRDIEAYLARLQLTPRRDPTNEDPRFTRNRLRQQLLPAVDAFDAAARELLARTADILGEEDRFLEEQVAALPDDIARDREAFARLPRAIQRRVVRHLVPDAGFLEVEAVRRADQASATPPASLRSGELQGPRPGRSPRRRPRPPAADGRRPQAGRPDAPPRPQPAETPAGHPGRRPRSATSPRQLAGGFRRRRDRLDPGRYRGRKQARHARHPPPDAPRNRASLNSFYFMLPNRILKNPVLR